MNPFRIPVIGKLVLGGAGTVILTGSLLGTQATSALAAGATPRATPAQATSPAAKQDPSDRKLIRRAVFAGEASVLGLKLEDLRSALRSGKTVEQLAQARSMNKEQFADRLATTVKPDLDRLVDAHKISRAQADKVLAGIHAGHILFWNGVHHKKAA